MKISLILLAGAGMLFLGVPSVTYAQGTTNSGSFNDVPADHWAYGAVDNLQKAGIVIGYPDGTYGGRRAMTRYEFAVAIARLVPTFLHSEEPNWATKDNVTALRSDLENKLAAHGAVIGDLKKLVNEFRPELAKLGQDVAAIQKRLSALEVRVTAIEAEQRRVKFNGALNLIARGDSVNKGGSFVDKNGITQGGNKHLLQTSDVYHDFLLTIQGRLTDTANANVKLDFGNYLSALGNTAAIGFTPGGLGGSAGISPGQLTPASQQTTVWEAFLEAPVSLGPLGSADLVAGRFGNSLTKYTLKQIDADVYTNLYQTDNGKIPTDGIKATLKLGPVGTTLFVGKMSAIPNAQPYGGSQYTGAAQLRPKGESLANHAASLTQGAGARFTLGGVEAGMIGLTIEQFGLDTATGALAVDPNTGKTYNRLSVYGADYSGPLPLLKKTGLKLDASLTVSAHGRNNGFNNAGQGWRYVSHEEQLGFTIGGLQLNGGYQYVGSDFTAPGYWGKIGSWTNPTNVEGGVAFAKYALSPRLTVNGDYESYKTASGRTQGGLVSSSPMQQGDKLNRYQIGLGYGLNRNNSLDLGYEQVEYNLSNTNGALAANPASPTFGRPTEKYITLGLDHRFNDNASFKLLYQIVQYDDKNSGFDPSANYGKTDGDAAVGQFSLKF